MGHLKITKRMFALKMTDIAEHFWEFAEREKKYSSLTISLSQWGDVREMTFYEPKKGHRREEGYHAIIGAFRDEENEHSTLSENLTEPKGTLARGEEEPHKLD